MLVGIAQYNRAIAGAFPRRADSNLRNQVRGLVLRLYRPAEALYIRLAAEPGPRTEEMVRRLVGALQPLVTLELGDRDGAGS